MKRTRKRTPSKRALEIDPRILKVLNSGGQTATAISKRLFEEAVRWRLRHLASKGVIERTAVPRSNGGGVAYVYRRKVQADPGAGMVLACKAEVADADPS